MPAEHETGRRQPPADLAAAIEKVASGGRYLSATFAEKLAFGLGPKKKAAPHETLSDREFQVLIAMASGKSASAISKELHLNKKTVSTYRRRILDKMGMETNAELIRYANERGVKIYAYIGKHTFNGTYGIKHPDANAGGAAELIPFHPGVHEYWNAFIRRIIEIGFDGFVFEDPEANHVPNQNEMCYKTFWEPWQKEVGYTTPKKP